MKKLIGFIAVLSLVLTMLAGCNSKGTSSGGDTPTYKMGLLPWTGYAPWYIAEETGLFKKYKINVKLVSFKQDADLNAAFASDDIQLANIASHTALRMVGQNGLDIKSIVFLDESTKADAMITSGKYQSFADLKGKKVAYEEGTTSDLLFKQALKDNNLTSKDFQVVLSSAADAGIALASNKVDAAVTYEPYISEIKNKNKDVHAVYSGSDAPGLISDMTVAKSSFLKENPKLQDKLEKVWQEALDYWKKNPDKGNEIVAKGTGSAVEDLPPILEGIKFFSIDEQQQLMDSGDLTKNIEKIKGILSSQEKFKHDVNVQNILAIK
ncbi:transporter substrate-binding domain-containing protein [Terrilactibacillus sp. BCM23-1]|uniref:Transporter substrate-binding domain-containing protein n=1 Tax=Terrilactibacillus tamarindi TaxID=2599694 RepID=A0A6N8CM94_9BACI|nr:ABC transporter substrate-binding protein [Terrilactibacillus tamarindi]MTT31154.1 transporter substrate-binding domain-containing protein [Terrilactibacillus tamarindi]